MATATLVRDARAHRARFVSLCYDLQRERLTLDNLVGRYQAVCRRCGLPEVPLALRPVTMVGFARNEHGMRVMVHLSAIGGAELDNDGFPGMPRSASALAFLRRPVPGGMCLAILGEVDLASATELLARLKAFAANDEHLVVDLTDLRYIDTTGIRALIAAYSAFRIRNLRFSLGGATSGVKKVLDIVGMSELVPLFDTVESAVRDLAEHN